jgi:hypothetical protein
MCSPFLFAIAHEKSIMLTVADLSAEAISKIRAYQWDRIIEKHEGPESWASVLDIYDPEFLTIAGFPVLLPIEQKRHPNITILRSIISRDGDSLTVFLKDTTHCPDLEHEMFCAGRMAVCDRVPGEGFFLAIVFHEWFVIDSGRMQGTMR